MTPQRWQQVKSVLVSALEREDTRTLSTFLTEACANDTDLRREVQSLLDQPPDQFETVAERIGLVNPDLFAADKAGRRIGAYELVRELGRGGMGTVWLARRADQHFEKLVAIKLLKRGTDTDEVLSRFQAERQILARLDHPNIARLLDAGTTDDELPYFVMEYVEGVRLTDFVREKNLSLGHRLHLFLKICAAVQFAHQNLVVHRDLKPSNILVTAEGEPKLLDFGVAKLLAPGDDAWLATMAGAERFTPGYASPEQVQGAPITTVSDVYSLGALLYEILTGRTPHRFPTETPRATEIARVVCEEEPARPSAAATDPEMRRQLRGDLDNILLRALAKAPERRYRGAGNLADDLRRYLGHRPVRARPDTFGYRAGKFLRRNKKAALTGTLLFLSLLAGVIATGREAQIANRERARAERRFNEVRKIANSLMFEFHNLIAELPGSLAARQLVTQRAGAYLDSLVQEAGDDLSLKSELALAYEKIGKITFDMGEAVLTHEKAISLNEALVKAAPGNTGYRIQLSQSYDEMSDAMKIVGHSQRAIDYARKSLGIVQSIATASPARSDQLKEIAQRYLGLAIALFDAGDFRGALTSSRTALQLQEKIAGNSSDAHARRDLASTYSQLADDYSDAGESEQAIMYAGKASDTARQMFDAAPSNSRHRRDLWAAHFRIGRLLAAKGDAKGALENYRAAVELMEGLAALDPNDTGHRRWLALTYSAMGDACAALDERENALSLQEKAMAISEKLVREDSNRGEARRDVVKISRSLGLLALANGQPDRALNYFDHAFSIADQLLRDDPDNARVRSALADALAGVADCYRKLAGQSDEQVTRKANLRSASQLSEQSLKLWEQVRSNGMLSDFDLAKPEAVAHMLADCNAALIARNQ